MRDTVFICETCLGADGKRAGPDLVAAVRAALGAEDARIDVVPVACLNLCDEPVTLALRGAGKMAYLFSGVEPGDVADIAALARLYAAAPAGGIEDARPAGRLRFCLKGRIPAV